MAVLKIKREYFSVIAIFLCIYFMFRFPLSVKEGVTQGLSICFYTIIPSLFPFMTLSTYIIKSNVFYWAYKFLTPVAKLLFRQNSCCVPVIIMSMIGGFPLGIKMTNELYSREQITKKQAQRLCLFCMNAGPAFVVTAVGVNMLNSTKAGVIIYASLCISSLFLGIVSRFLGDKNEESIKIKSQIQMPLSTLSASVSDALQSILGICAWVVIFSSITACIKTLNLNENLYVFLTSVSEVTKGCALISGKMSLPIISGVIGFGGICVHCQVLGYIRHMELKYSHFLVSRILNGALAALITHLLLLIFPVETDVFAAGSQISAVTFSVSTPAFFVFIGMCIIMIFDIDRKKKIW